MLILDPQRLRAAREASGLSQEAAAHRVGATSKAVQKWEAGLARPRSDYVARLAEVYGVDLASLFVDDPAQVAS